VGNGESFGSYLGEVYANMFPGRVRAIAIDGIVDPATYAGTQATANVPVIVRVGAGAASDRALTELLTLCQQAGSSRCSFASSDTYGSPWPWPQLTGYAGFWHPTG
jgi:pimeloyl-ACP methyl ester carboxylesterase